MIATILHSSPSFNAVYYNERKVAQGVASLIEINNFGGIETQGYDSPDELVEYLKEWTAQSDRIKKAQFHVALSCKGQEMTEQELVDFAHAYLQEMGYYLPNQPLLIYAHRDTDNNHIHIISSRVGTDGKKIDDHHERRKSQKVLEKIGKLDLKSKTKKDITAALGFNFRSVTQFKAVLEAMNYECYQKSNKLYVKKGGMVQDSVDMSLIEKLIQTNQLSPDYKNKTRYTQLWAIIKKYKNMNSSLIGFEKDLKEKFGISLVFFGSKDSPYGYAIVDFKNKAVLEGGKVMKLKELLTFMTPEEHQENIESLIDRCFEENPNITTKEINKRLFKVGAFIKKNEIHYGNNKIPLNDLFSDQLSRNNKIEWVSSFKPTTESEREVVCRFGKITNPDLIKIHSTAGVYNPAGLSELQNICAIAEYHQRKDRLEKEGFIIVRKDGVTYAYNPKLKSIIDLKKANLPVATPTEILSFLQNTLSRNPFITTNKLNTILALNGASLSKKDLLLGNSTIPLTPDMAAQLKRNNLIQYINLFNPQDEIERDILCQTFNFKEVNFISVGKGKIIDHKNRQGSTRICTTLQMQNPMDILLTMEKEDFFIRKHPMGCYALNSKLKSIIDLDKLNVPEWDGYIFNNIISSLLKEDPSITTYEINKRLGRLGATIKKDKIEFGDIFFDLSESLKPTLKINDSISWLNKFNPTNELERNLICDLFKLPESEIDRVAINSDVNFVPNDLLNVRNIMSIPNLHHRYAILEDEGYRVIRQYGKIYLLNSKNQNLIDIRKFGLPEIGRLEIEAFIRESLSYDAYTNTEDLNKQMFLMGAYISKNEIRFGDVSWPINEEISIQLKRNNMIDWLSSFNPTNEIERDIICRFTGFKDNALIRINDDVKTYYYPNGLYKLTQILSIPEPEERKLMLENSGWRFTKENGETYAFNGKIGCIINLNKTEIPKHLYPDVWSPKNIQSLPSSQHKNHQTLQKISGALRTGHGGDNREWEVGKKGPGEDDPDRYQGFSY